MTTESFNFNLSGDQLKIDDYCQRQADRFRKSQQQMEALINNSPAAMYLKDLEGRYQLINQTCVDLSGVDAQAFLGQTDYAFFPPAIAKQICDRDQEIIRSGESITFEEIATHLDGTTHIYLSTKFVLTDEEGKPYALGGVSTDITDLHQANQRLESTNTELQQANRRKDEFLATISHELRTPLNVILGMSESLQEAIYGELNSSQLKSISTIAQSGQHLLALIDDMLDVAEISAGNLTLNITEVSPIELCKSSLKLVEQQALAKQIHIDTHIPEDLDRIFVDQQRICQVLINLLNNAVKFTPTGGKISLSVRLAPLEIRGYCLCFAVSDTGIGINSADLAKLFQPFSQLDSSLNRQYQGTGLGLVLVKQIVELHGGTMAIDSEVGSGSCFTVTLPQPQINSIHIAAPSPLILLAEDNELNINTFSSYLTAKGYRIIWAYNGREAIELTQSHDPDLILMDIQMPEMDGLEAISWMRRQPKLVKIPIIALTALAMAGDREKCLGYGANEYLAKPVKLKELHHRIQSFLAIAAHC